MHRREDDLGFLLADVSRLVRHAFRRRIEDGSLTYAQARALIYLSRHEGVHQGELADMLDVQAITLARLIDCLDENGLVERRVDPADRRAHQLFLTPAATSHLAAIGTVVDSIHADALRGIDRKESVLVLSALRKIRGNLARD